jgi:type I site-specific restriction endonuclease
MITANVESYDQYLQMLGRGSRTRGICDGILYKVTEDKPKVVLEKLQRQNFAAIGELQSLLKVLEHKFKDATLLGLLKSGIEKGQPIRSLKQVEEAMGPAKFKKLIAGMKL